LAKGRAEMAEPEPTAIALEVIEKPGRSADPGKAKKVEEFDYSYHLNRVSEDLRSLFVEAHNSLLLITDSVVIKTAKSRISYWAQNLKFGSIWPSAKSFKIEAIEIDAKTGNNNYVFLKVSEKTDLTPFLDKMRDYIAIKTKPKPKKTKATKKKTNVTKKR